MSYPVSTHEQNEVPRIYASAQEGLSGQDVSLRYREGYSNKPVDPPTKTPKQIVLSHLLTYFNLIFFVLAMSLVFVGRFQELAFSIIIITNIVCGIVQEFNSKRVMDQMQLLNTPQALVVRDGKQERIPTEQLVRDDIVCFGPGDQIYADATVVSGSVLANESLITGEADEISKKQGDFLLSGSFILSGTCYARLDHVGADSYVSKLSMEAKSGGKDKETPMVRSLNRLVFVIGTLIIPIGIMQAIRQTAIHESIVEGVSTTVAIVIAMVPEGLYLLTTAALAVSVIHLARRKVLVQRMHCIETLARVTMLCVDKTGTITETKMTVQDMIPLCEERFNADDLRMIMSDYVGNMGADNETMLALKKYFRGNVMQGAIKILPFSSSLKYGGVSYADDENYLLGAPDILLGDSYGKYAQQIEHYSSLGCRVLLLALYDGNIEVRGLEGGLMPLALILLNNKVRREAPETFAYFAKQGVAIKVISGDNPLTVSHVAQEAGIEGAQQYVDATTLTTPQALYEAAKVYTVFGRVKPDQKRTLVRALRAQGHTVAMTGDGVNDVLALKDADCSIAMASGADVACRVSQLVLLNSNFGAMPSVVAEGRRVINNIERSASLFLVRNIFALFLALFTLFAALPLTLLPNQMSLIGGLTIGIPAFVLALEPNFKRIEGNFLRNVIFRAIPAALTNVILVIGVIMYSIVFELSPTEMSTMTLVILSLVGVMMVYQVCKPFNFMRRVLFGGVVVSMTASFLLPFFRGIFSIHPLGLEAGLLLAVFIASIYPIMRGLRIIMSRLLGDKLENI